jgi:hypothetical protein
MSIAVVVRKIMTELTLAVCAGERVGFQQGI